MSIAIAEPHFLAWLMHDADMLVLTTTWDAEGIVSMFLTCHVNAEEDMTPLHELGVVSHHIIIELRDVCQSTVHVRGDYTPRPVLDRWEIDPSTPLLDKTPHPQVDRLLHHRFTTMSGSAMEVVFRSLWIQEAFS